jgi:hypothetical protein
MEADRVEGRADVTTEPFIVLRRMQPTNHRLTAVVQEKS